MEFHEVANIFPMMTGNDYKDLRDDIAANGLREPIYVYEGKILDGRNRYTACLDLGIEPKYKEYTGNDPVAFVVSENIKRRHLTSSQLAVCALDILPRLEAEAEKNRRTRISEYRSTGETSQIVDSSKSSAKAAKNFETNRQYVSDAKKLAEKAPDLLEDVKTGEITIPQAKRELVKREKIEAPPLPTDKYKIIYADPPWQYGDKLIDGYGAAEHHYPSMTIEELCLLPIKELTDINAVLFLWVTSPLLEECFAVINSWGFRYKSSFVWDKVKHNYGHYNSVRHELLLICTKGSCLPDTKELIDSVQSIERTEHSTKPEEFRIIIDTLYPTGKRIELFARDKHENWEVWGNESISS